MPSMVEAPIDIQTIGSILPQTYPFLLIDRIIEFKKGESLTAIKNITGNEWMFGVSEGDSVDVFPETLIIEAAAQTALMFYALNREDPSGKVNVLLGQAKAEFLRPVTLGDQMILKVLSSRKFGKSGLASLEVSVDQEKAADIEIFYSLRN